MADGHVSLIKTIKNHVHGERPPASKQITPVIARKIAEVPKRKKK